MPVKSLGKEDEDADAGLIRSSAAVVCTRRHAVYNDYSMLKLFELSMWEHMQANILYAMQEA
jgi:hypothetical protein